MNSLPKSISLRIILLLSLLLYQGCSSVGLFYDYAPIFVNWEIDSYFDLSPEQEEWVEHRVRAQFAWHRKQELPTYIDFLREVQRLGGDGLTLAEVKEGHQRIQAYWKRVIDHLLEDSALFLSKIEPRQVDYLEQRFEDENLEWQESRAATRKERKEERYEELLDGLEDWLGDFSPSQDEQLQDLFNHWYQNRLDPILDQERRKKERQQIFLSFLRNKPLLEETRIWLDHWFRNWTDPKVSKAHERREQRIMRNMNRILQVDALLVQKQRDHAVEEIEIWIKRFEDSL